MDQQFSEITDEYDREFISLMMAIERRSETLNKYDKLRIKNWCKKLCQVTNNLEWKKNRNLHAICILDSVLNEHFEEPYNKFPPEGSVPILNKTLVKSRLSSKFFQETFNLEGDEDANNNMNNINSSISTNKKDKNTKSKSINYETNESPNELKLREETAAIINELKQQLEDKESENCALREENLKLSQKVEELEKMLSSFMEMEKNN